MEAELSEEFFLLLESVTAKIRDGSIFGRFGAQSVCRWVVLPSFDNPWCYEVREVKVRRNREPRLYRACWRNDLDQNAFHDPLARLKYPRPFVPTVEVGWVGIDLGAVEGILERLGSVPVSLTVRDRLWGLDGTSFELTLGNSFCESRLTWWEELPEEWQPIAEKLKDLLTLFQSTWALGAPGMDSTDQHREAGTP